MFNLIGPEYYPIYLGVMFILIGEKLIFKSSDGLIVGYDRFSLLKASLISVFFIFFFGFRPSGIFFADTHVYAGTYEDILYYGVNNEDTKGDLLFEWVRNMCALLRLPVEGYFCVVAALYLIPIIIGSRILFPGREYISLLFFCSSFAFYSGGGVIIRNGVACSFIFLAIALWYKAQNRKDRILSLLCLIAAYYFHNSAAISAFAFVLSILFIRKVSWSVIIWLICIILALVIGRSLGYTISEYFQDDRLTSYAEAGLDVSNLEGFAYSGFRWDFLLYSLTGIVFSVYTRYYKNFKDKFFDILSNTYILSNAVWILFIYATFSDRFARLSWCLLPFVFLYPLVKFKSWPYPNRITGWILMGQWLFLFILGLSSLIFFFSTL